MKGTKKVAVALVVCSAAAASSASAQVGGEVYDQGGVVEETAGFGGMYSSFNDHTDQVTFSIMDDQGRSMTMVLDRASDRAYVSDSLGRTMDISLVALGNAYAPGSTGTALTNEIRSSLLNDVGYEMLGNNYESLYQMQLPQIPGGYGPCAMEPCPPRMPNVGFLGGEYTYRSQYVSFPETWEQFYSAETIRVDRAGFDRWQADRCEAAQEDLEDAIAVGLMTVASCAAGGTGIGAAGCVVGYADTARLMIRSGNKDRQCNSRYKGPGTW